MSGEFRELSRSVLMFDDIERLCEAVARATREHVADDDNDLVGDFTEVCLADIARRVKLLKEKI